MPTGDVVCLVVSSTFYPCIIGLGRLAVRDSPQLITTSKSDSVITSLVSISELTVQYENEYRDTEYIHSIRTQDLV